MALVWRVLGTVSVCAALAACQTADGGGPGPMASAASVDANSANQLTTCEKPLGTASVVEADPSAMAYLAAAGLPSPTPMLRIMMTDSNCFRVIDQAAVAPGRRPPPVRWSVTPNILQSNPNAGGVSAGGFLGNVTGQRWMNGLGGSISVKDAQTALFVADGRTGEQIASVQGSATATDFGVSFISRSGLNSVGAFGNTPEGKVIMAAYGDAFNKMVAQLQAREPAPRVANARRAR